MSDGHNPDDACALCGGTGHARSECPWADKLVTLLDGTQVSSHHPAWRLECWERFTHIQRMRAMQTRDQVQAYVAGHRKKYGDEAASRLKVDWAADVQNRKEMPC